MANPGPYPMGPAMGGPMQPMGGPPMAGMMPRPPARQGTSRVVPVVVSAGLAIGVFCGLLFGLGTGKKAVLEQPKVSNNAKSNDDYTPETLANPNVKGQEKNGQKVAPAVAANTGSGSNAGSAEPAANAGSAAPAEKPVKLIVEITPETVAQAAKVFVDDKPITGLSTDIALDPGTSKKKVKVVVKAPGYRDVGQETEAEGESVTVKFELMKGRSTLTAGTTGAGASDGGAAPAGNTAAGNTGAGNTAAGNTGAGNTGHSSGSTSGGTTGTGTKNTGGKNTGKTGKGKGSGGLIDI